MIRCSLKPALACTLPFLLCPATTSPWALSEPRGKIQLASALSGGAVDYAGSAFWSPPRYVKFVVLLLVGGVAVLLCNLAMALLRAMFRSRREYLRSRRADAGLCAGCGYDLRAANDRCPECGTPAAERTEAKP